LKTNKPALIGRFSFALVLTRRAKKRRPGKQWADRKAALINPTQCPKPGAVTRYTAACGAFLITCHTMPGNDRTGLRGRL